MDSPRIVNIQSIKEEAHEIKTITFLDTTPIHPGQFYMIWIPEVDEIPMSVSTITPHEKGITFRRVGEATTSLFQLKKGDKIGIRGPYGNGFRLKGKTGLFVAGGTGIAMMAPTIENAVQQKIQVDAILGVKTKNELFFYNRLKQLDINLHVATDDGTMGNQGTAVHLAEKLLNNINYDAIYTCGPEKMMKALYILNTSSVFQASLERYMKCGIGLCGQCCVGQGQRVCVEGPVFQKDQLQKINDFGVFTRDSSGKKMML